MSEEKLPVHDTIKVIDYQTIYKTSKWWCAVVLANMFGHDKVLIYLWQNRNGQWKRKQKFTINFEHDWQLIKQAVDNFLLRVREVSDADNR